MPRAIIPISTEYPYHVTARCINRRWFSLNLPTVWSLMEDYLYLSHELFSIQIHSFVLMPNHFHLLVSAPQGNLSPFLLYFMRETSREITRLSKRVNQTYGARNHKCLINRYSYFVNCYKYVYQNPLKANLCKSVESYPYSTLSGLLGLKPLLIPLAKDELLFNPTPNQEILRWLNTRREQYLEEEMRLALKRPIMKFKTSRKIGRISELADSRF